MTALDVGGRGPAVANEAVVSPFVLPDTAPVADRITRLGVSRAHPDGEVVLRQGSPSNAFHVVATGRVRCTVLRPDGTERVVAYVEAGASVGEVACFDAGPCSVTAVTVGPTRTSTVDRVTLLDAARRDPEMLLEVARRVARNERLLHLHLALDALSARDRMVLILARLVDAHGVPNPDGNTRFRLRLGVEDLASLVGLGRVAASREVSRLISGGVLLRRGRDLLVRDTRTLRSLAATVDT